MGQGWELLWWLSPLPAGRAQLRLEGARGRGRCGGGDPPRSVKPQGFGNQTPSFVHPGVNLGSPASSQFSTSAGSGPPSSPSGHHPSPTQSLIPVPSLPHGDCPRRLPWTL